MLSTANETGNGYSDTENQGQNQVRVTGSGDEYANAEEALLGLEQKGKEASTSPFVKMDPEQTAVFTFNPMKWQTVMKDFKGDKNFKARTYWTVLDHEGNEKTFELAKRYNETIIGFLRAGVNDIQVTRHGTLLNTEYTFAPPARRASDMK